MEQMMTNSDKAKAVIGGFTKALARQSVMDSPSYQFGDSMIYILKAGWEAEEILSDSRMARPKNGRGLKAAMADAEIASILLTKDAAVNLEIVKSACETSGLDKTIFIEKELCDV